MPTGVLGMVRLSALRGPVTALYDNLASADGVLWLEELKKFVRKEPCWVAPRETPFRWVSAGVGGLSGDALILRLESSGVYISKEARNRIRAQPSDSGSVQQPIKFARVRVRELGFELPPTTEELRARILASGHSFCEPVDGPWVRLALTRQSIGPWIMLVERSESEQEEQKGYLLRSFAQPWLEIYRVAAGGVWKLDTELVFRYGTS